MVEARVVHALTAEAEGIGEAGLVEDAAVRQQIADFYIRRKGIDTFVRAAAELPEVRFVVAGRVADDEAAAVVSTESSARAPSAIVEASLLLPALIFVPKGTSPRHSRRSLRLSPPLQE